MGRGIDGAWADDMNGYLPKRAFRGPGDQGARTRRESEAGNDHRLKAFTVIWYMIFARTMRNDPHAIEMVNGVLSWLHGS